MSFTVSDDVLRNGRPPNRELAFELYRRERISLGRAAEVADVSRRDFTALLEARGLYLTLDVDDLEQDLATMRRLRLL